MRKMYSKKQIEGMINNSVDSENERFFGEVQDVIDGYTAESTENELGFDELCHIVDENSEKLKIEDIYLDTFEEDVATIILPPKNLPILLKITYLDATEVSRIICLKLTYTNQGTLTYDVAYADDEDIGLNLHYVKNSEENYIDIDFSGSVYGFSTADSPSFEAFFGIAL